MGYADYKAGYPQKTQLQFSGHEDAGKVRPYQPGAETDGPKFTKYPHRSQGSLKVLSSYGVSRYPFVRTFVPRHCAGF